MEATGLERVSYNQILFVSLFPCCMHAVVRGDGGGGRGSERKSRINSVFVAHITALLITSRDDVVDCDDADQWKRLRNDLLFHPNKSQWREPTNHPSVQHNPLFHTHNRAARMAAAS